MMAGRTRRGASSSTVATIDQETVRYYKEASLLKPVTSDVHSDDWPCFLLCDATVHRRDGSLVNLLHVDMEGPFILRGRLELEFDNRQYLINRNMKAKSIFIQVESSHTFSVGAKDDSLSVPVVWANGLAGWFEIIPSKEYRPICDFMFEAVGIHYSFLDQYEAGLEQLQAKRKNRKSPPTLADVEIDLDELLFQYALHAGDGLTLPEAYDRLHNQATFILSHFPKETGVSRYLAEKFPHIARELAEKVASKMAATGKKKGPTPPPCALLAYDYSSREQSSSSIEAPEVVKKGKGRAKTVIPRGLENGQLLLPDIIIADISKRNREPGAAAKLKRKLADTAGDDDDLTILDVSSINAAPPGKKRNQDHSTADSGITAEANKGNVVVEALQDVRRDFLRAIADGRQKVPLHKITPKNWRLKVFLECNIKNSRCLEEIFLYYARDLVDLLGPEWHNTELYRWAKENAPKQVTLTAITEADIKALRRRVHHASRASRAEKLAEDNVVVISSESPADTSTEKMTENTASETSHPEVRAYASKQIPRQTRTATRAAGLRPSTVGSKKRLRHEPGLEDEVIIDEDETSRKKAKKAHYMTIDDGDSDNERKVDINDNYDSDNDNDRYDNDDDFDEEFSDDNKAQNANGSLRSTQLVIRAETLPSARALGPNQTWTCPEPKCGHVVRGADEEKGQKLIGAHYEEHEKEAQDLAPETAVDRVNLAVKEARGHMPINYLLEKIRNLGEKGQRPEETQLNGRPVPGRIKRTLPV